MQVGLIPENPVKRVKMPAHKRIEVNALELDQTAAFIQAAKADRLFALYPLAIDSGCRQGELLGMDVNFDRGTVSITKSLEEVGGQLAIKEPKTSKARRTVALSEFTLETLQEHGKAMLSEGVIVLMVPFFAVRGTRLGFGSQTYIAIRLSRSSSGRA